MTPRLRQTLIKIAEHLGWTAAAAAAVELAGVDLTTLPVPAMLVPVVAALIAGLVTFCKQKVIDTELPKE